MLAAILRKSRQLADDPALRRWLLARALRLTPGEPAYNAHRPPYLAGWSELAAEAPTIAHAKAAEGAPESSLRMRLAGLEQVLEPGEEAGLVQRLSKLDLETQLSWHRFAWVPLMEPGADPRWLAAIWRVWAEGFGSERQGWAWHPYTATERAVNLLEAAPCLGLPEGAAEILAASAPIIAQGLEWFGDHHTSNHCANNGRGLYLLGLGLGLPQAAALGARVLEEEGKRIFRPSGVLREGSTHYHLLLTRQWASVWLAARRHNRPEASLFEPVLRRALSVLPSFHMAGRFPLMGDVSPDCPPSHLFGLLPGGDSRLGWTGALDEGEAEALGALAGVVEPEALRQDGWLRRDLHGWSGLWRATPEGWSPMPGHGHQDCGAPEIHHDGLALLIDPGRGSYRLAGEADPFVAGSSHGGLTLDGRDPYPPNRPYYAPEFRAKLAGGARLKPEPDGVSLEHGGFARLGAAKVIRRWTMEPGRLVIEDRVEGRGRHVVARALVTGLKVSVEAEGALLVAPDGRRYRVKGETRPEARPTTIWTAYGEGSPGTALVFAHRHGLPWSGRIVIEVA